jgi:hypothetical protein
MLGLPGGDQTWNPIRIFISYAHANAIWLRKTVRDRSGVEEASPRDLPTY